MRPVRALPAIASDPVAQPPAASVGASVGASVETPASDGEARWAYVAESRAFALWDRDPQRLVACAAKLRETLGISGGVRLRAVALSGGTATAV